ncbi:MAG: response regulator [bacterium]|nr:response regulator [bacterium]
MSLLAGTRVILLVDDDALIAMAQAQELREYGYEVITVYTGAKAVETVKQHSEIDLILMDIDLGHGMDGTTTAEIILKEQNIPIVFFSSHIDPEIVGRTEKITSYGYVVKESGITVLDASIKMAFKLYEANRNIWLHKNDLEVTNEELKQTIEELEATNSELEATNEQLAESQEEVLERENALVAQHALVIAISGTLDRNELLNYCLEAALRLPEMDCGGIYLIDQDSGDLSLAVYSGCDPGFAKQVSHYGADSEQAQLIMEGRPLYVNYQHAKMHLYELQRQEGLKGSGIIPIINKGSVIACLIASSKRQDQLSLNSCTILETIAGQIGGAIARALVDETLQKNLESLKETEESLRSEKEFIDTVLNAQRDTFFLFEAATGKALRWNKAFSEISGYTNQEIAELVAPAAYYSSDDMERAGSFVKQVLNEGIGKIELSLICKDGKTVPTEYEVSSIVGANGKPGHFISIGRDVADRKRNELALQNALQEKNELIRELQHRVKNSFTTIASMIVLESGRTENDEVKQVLGDMNARVGSLSELYSMLYESGSVREARLEEYCGKVVHSLARTYAGISGLVDIVSDFDSITAGVKEAATVGLILTELVTNAMKYAFPDKSGGTIRVALKLHGDTILLEVADNGIGLPADFDRENSNTLGLRLVTSLSAQFNGELEIESGSETVLRVRFLREFFPVSLLD